MSQTMSQPILNAFAPLLDEAERTLTRLQQGRDADVAALLRAAHADVAESVSAAPDAVPAVAARLWDRCARGETALSDAVREARRRRRLDPADYRRFQRVALVARRSRSAAMTLLRCSNIA